MSEQEHHSTYGNTEYPIDVVLLVVLWRLRYKLSLRDLAEMFLERGWVFTHEAVEEWEARFAPLLAEHLRTKRRGQAGPSWYVDETYMRVKGKWCYLYRAIDDEGNLVDSCLSEKRDMAATQQFFYRHFRWLAMLQNASRPMAIPPTREQYVKPWATLCNIELVSTSIIS